MPKISKHALARAGERGVTWEDLVQALRSRRIRKGGRLIVRSTKITVVLTERQDEIVTVWCNRN
jgi:hypothetical protein